MADNVPTRSRISPKADTTIQVIHSLVFAVEDGKSILRRVAMTLYACALSGAHTLVFVYASLKNLVSLLRRARMGNESAFSFPPSEDVI